MLIGIAPIGGIDFAPKAKAMDLSSHKVGDLIEFGSYPQSEVKDSDLIAKIEAAGANISWIDYNYYAGTGEFSDGNMKPVEGMMLYKDISYDGNKYRAVKINHYRPLATCYPSSSNRTYQEYNGYCADNVYYFKYEPLTWYVLDPSDGYVICNSIIDSQAYQNIIYCNGDEFTTNSGFYNSKSCTNYASDWVTSSLRRWLNKDFYEIAFTDTEKSQIGISHLENKSYTDSKKYDSGDTYDNIFSLSYYDAINSTYGFDPDDKTEDTVRQRTGTDYAKCQGLYCSRDSETFKWWLRSPQGSRSVAVVDKNGFMDQYIVSCHVYSTITGVVPALHLSLIQNHYAHIF